MKFLSRTEAAEYVQGRGLRCAPKTLAKLATIGGGPLYQRFGLRAVYTTDSLDAWIAQRLSKPINSTSELIDEEEAAA